MTDVPPRRPLTYYSLGRVVDDLMEMTITDNGAILYFVCCIYVTPTNIVYLNVIINFIYKQKHVRRTKSIRDNAELRESSILVQIMWPLWLWCFLCLKFPTTQIRTICRQSGRRLEIDWICC